MVAQLGSGGKTLRKRVARSELGNWKPAPDRPDPLAILQAQEQDRLPDLLPIRHERMRASAFGFYRGAAAIMAADLAHVPVTGLHVQLCGDAHLANFGGYATPERRVVFDVNDFDETLPGPWEWDVLRLAASIEVGARDRGVSPSASSTAVSRAVQTYRLQIRRYAGMTPLEIWYSRTDVRRIDELRGDTKKGSGEHMPPQLVQGQHGVLRFVPDPPLVEPLDASDERVVNGRALIEAYRHSLSAHVRPLIDRYKVVDFARKVVGVGSVGTRCYVVLLATERNEPLLLQLKEATVSVLEAHLPHSTYVNHAERVVVGQERMQAASDLFLGWTRSDDGHDFYVRQLRDMKTTVDLTALSPGGLADYANYCAWALARAHARTGDPQAIASYLGRSDAFDKAVAAFARAYGRQNELDYRAFVESTGSAVKAASKPKRPKRGS